MKRAPLLWLSLASLALAAGLNGCETPEAFHVSGDGGLLANGTGGDKGSGGGNPGTGGIVATGGSPGTGGINLSTGGTVPPATGGAGGHVSTGGGVGSGHGGSAATGGMGGQSTGGAIATGGTASGGTVGGGGHAGSSSGGSGGMTPGSGGSSNGGHMASGGSMGMGGAAGGTVGTGPCAGLCTPATDFHFSMATQYQSSNVGSGAVCDQVATALTIQGGGCSNCSSRTIKINGTTVSNTAQWTSDMIPAKVNGGYCVQISAGSPDFASFYTF